MDKIYLEQILEVRFKPDPKILDKRGDIAATLGDAFLNKWSITPNSIELKSENEAKVKAFFGFRNMGVSSNYPYPKDDFLNLAKDYIKRGWHLIPFNNLERIGVSTKLIVETDNFTEYLRIFREKFIALNDDQLGQFGGDLVDISIPLNFSEGLNQFNIVLGPIQKEELEVFFKDQEKTIPDYGLFSHVDYFTTEISPSIKQKDILTFIDTGVAKADSVMDTLIALLK